MKSNNYLFEKNITLYKWFSFLIMTPIMMPIIVIFWENNGLDTFDIYLLQAIFAIAVVLLEVPTGMVADVLGKKKSLLFGTTIAFFSFIIYGLGHGFVVFLIAEVGLAFGLALISGADSALLYDSLVRLNRVNEYQKLEGQIRSNQMISFGLCTLLGGFIGSYSLKLAMLSSAIGPFLAFFLALGLTEVLVKEKNLSFKTARQQYKTLIQAATKFVFKHKLIRWYILFASVLMGSSTWLLWMYQPYMKLIGLPIWSFGAAFLLFNLHAALTSRYAYKISEILGKRKTIGLIMLFHSLPSLLMALFISPFSVLFILGHQTTRGFFRPVLNDWILQYTYEDKRATVLSINSLSGRLFFAVTGPVIGFIGKHTSMQINFITQFSSLSVIFIVLFVLYLKIPSKYFSVKEKVKQNQG